ncbi:WG repeat-containing protein [bacterium]|nr:WG repeat-containing protein [bacterium]
MMRKFLFILSLFIITQNCTFCETVTTNIVKPFTENNKYFGLKDNKETIVVKPIYKKVINLDNEAWIIQNKKNKFGLIDSNGKILIEPKYTHAERYFNKFVKLGNYKDFGLYNGQGTAIIPPEYNAIMPLFGKKFLTYKDYKYGVYNENGKMLLDNKYEFIYMPNPKTMRIKYENEWFEIQQISEGEEIKLPTEDISQIKGKHVKILKIFINTGVGAGYSIVTTTDYVIKLFSSISNAYEETIDELMLSQGVDTVSIFMKMSWLPKFPIIYSKNYWKNIIHPTKGPLSDVKTELKEQFK